MKLFSRFSFRNISLLFLISVLSAQSMALAASSVNPAPNGQQLLGTVEGSLSYPSEMIPKDLQVCAETLNKELVLCTDEHIVDSKYMYGEGFKLNMPPGEYYIYAQSDFFDQLNNTHFKGYYSDFSVCGGGAQCNSHNPIAVNVDPGQIVTGLLPNDWQEIL